MHCISFYFFNKRDVIIDTIPYGTGLEAAEVQAYHVSQHRHVHYHVVHSVLRKKVLTSLSAAVDR